ncbi:MAG: hypothetical protein ABII18_07360, partial [bacterium]
MSDQNIKPGQPVQGPILVDWNMQDLEGQIAAGKIPEDLTADEARAIMERSGRAMPDYLRVDEELAASYEEELSQIEGMNPQTAADMRALASGQGVTIGKPGVGHALTGTLPDPSKPTPKQIKTSGEWFDAIPDDHPSRLPIKGNKVFLLTNSDGKNALVYSESIQGIPHVRIVIIEEEFFQKHKPGSLTLGQFNAELTVFNSNRVSPLDPAVYQTLENIIGDKDTIAIPRRVNSAYTRAGVTDNSTYIFNDSFLTVIHKHQETADANVSVRIDDYSLFSDAMDYAIKHQEAELIDWYQSLSFDQQNVFEANGHKWVYMYAGQNENIQDMGILVYQPKDSGEDVVAVKMFTPSDDVHDNPDGNVHGNIKQYLLSGKQDALADTTLAYLQDLQTRAEHHEIKASSGLDVTIIDGTDEKGQRTKHHIKFVNGNIVCIGGKHNSWDNSLTRFTPYTGDVLEERVHSLPFLMPSSPYITLPKDKTLRARGSAMAFYEAAKADGRHTIRIAGKDVLVLVDNDISNSSVLLLWPEQRGSKKVIKIAEISDLMAAANDLDDLGFFRKYVAHILLHLGTDKSRDLPKETKKFLTTLLRKKKIIIDGKPIHLMMKPVLDVDDEVQVKNRALSKRMTFEDGGVTYYFSERENESIGYRFEPLSRVTENHDKFLDVVDSLLHETYWYELTSIVREHRDEFKKEKEEPITLGDLREYLSGSIKRITPLGKLLLEGVAYFKDSSDEIIVLFGTNHIGSLQLGLAHHEHTIASKLPLSKGAAFLFDYISRDEGFDEDGVLDMGIGSLAFEEENAIVTMHSENIAGTNLEQGYSGQVKVTLPIDPQGRLSENYCSVAIVSGLGADFIPGSIAPYKERNGPVVSGQYVIRFTTEGRQCTIGLDLRSKVSGDPNSFDSIPWAIQRIPENPQQDQKAPNIKLPSLPGVTPVSEAVISSGFEKGTIGSWFDALPDDHPSRLPIEGQRVFLVSDDSSLYLVTKRIIDGQECIDYLYLMPNNLDDPQVLAQLQAGKNSNFVHGIAGFTEAITQALDKDRPLYRFPVNSNSTFNFDKAPGVYAVTLFHQGILTTVRQHTDEIEHLTMNPPIMLATDWKEAHSQIPTTPLEWFQSLPSDSPSVMYVNATKVAVLAGNIAKEAPELLLCFEKETPEG